MGLNIDKTSKVFFVLIYQELSYRKQIARLLHTQYVEGIYSKVK